MRWLLVILELVSLSSGTLKSTYGNAGQSTIHAIGANTATHVDRGPHTRMRTRLSLRSTSVIASLLERDMFVDVVRGGYSKCAETNDV